MKKYFLFSLMVLALLTGCTTGSDQAGGKDVTLIRKYIQAVENMDYSTMADLLSDDYIGYGPSFGDSILKAEALENWKYNIENLYESIHYDRSRNVAVTIKDGPNKGEWVSNWGEVDIVYKNGKGRITLWANTIYQIADGKIIKSYTFYNEADALRQLGYIFCKPEDLKNEQ